MPRFGEIGLLDRNGLNAKTRPCVVVSKPDELAQGGPIRVAAISTLRPGPLPGDAIAMKYHPDGHPRTGLKTRCAAIASWVATIDRGRLIATIGHVPPKDLDAIVKLQEQIESKG